MALQSPASTAVRETVVSSDAHILVVDDEAEVRDLLKEYLIKQGFAVSAAASAAAAREVLAARVVDLVILDLRMPGEDGLSFARELRGRGGVAIVMLTASSETVDRVIGLEIGADDYVAKPFDPRELLARIRGVLRRIRPAPESKPDEDRRIVRFGRYVLDLHAHRLFALDHSEVPITTTEFELLEAFANNPNRVLSRDRLLEFAHKRGNDPFDRSIDNRVARLRQKIEPHPDKPQTIKTVRGAGYVFVPAGETPDVKR
jgi:two-component system phosphate regulon response regulator OmpR